MTVEYAPDFKKSINGATIKRRIKHGTDFTLNCESNENPEATAKWSFSRTATMRDKIVIGNDAKSLKVTDMNYSKQGLYQCFIKNSVGHAIKYFNVIDYPQGK